LITFVQSLVLIVVAVTPWLPVIVLLIAAFWFLLRRANQGAVVSRARALSAEASSRDSGRGSPTP
jgi:hypothetical protein